MQLKGLSHNLFIERYAYPGDKDWNDRAYTISHVAASAERDDKKEECRQQFWDVLENGNFIPGGRIIFGAGRPKFNLLNCYVLWPEDHVESISQVIKDSYLISCGGGGIGYDFSRIRPRGDDIQNIKNSAPGAVSNMKMINEIGEHVRSGKNRRTALMGILRVDHPDLFEFLDAKLDKEALSNFNISVGITDEFIDAVHKNKEWHFTFNGRRYDMYKVIGRDISNDGPSTPVSVIVAALSEEDAMGRANVQLKPTYTTIFKKATKVKNIARDIWDKLFKSAVECGDPGIYNVDFANRYTNVSYFEFLPASNPCSVKETIVALADGTNKTIGELADANKDVDVYCLNHNGKMRIRKMRNPRLTGHNQPVYKVVLDNGDSIRVTANHQFLLTNGEYKKVKDFEGGESLHILTKSHASIKDIMPKANSKSQDYIWLTNSGIKGFTAEHRLIATHYDGDIPKGHVVHHKDYNGQNNDPSNLQIMSKKDHDHLHAKDMLGDKNPMRRAKYEWSEEKWIQYRRKLSKAQSAENNARYSGVTNEEIYNHALELTKQLNRRFSSKEWQEYATTHQLPTQFSAWRIKHLGKIVEMSKKTAKELNIVYDEDPRVLRTYNDMIDQGYNTSINNHCVLVEKKCEICNNDFHIEYSRREVACCSKQCGQLLGIQNRDHAKQRIAQKATFDNRKIQDRSLQLKVYTDLQFKFKRKPLKKEWEAECRVNHIRFRFGPCSPFNSYKDLQTSSTMFNHRVASVQFDGYEDVYNGTVDEFHNFFVGGWKAINRFDKPKFMYVNNLQCGEIPIPAYGNCCLGHINLSNMVDWNGRVQWKKMARTIRAAVRFLDNILTINHFAVAECREVGHRSRRIGMGVTGLHYFLIKAGYNYGDESCCEFVERLFQTIRDEAYKASIELAKERGAFTAFDADKYLEEEFAKTLPPRIRREIRKHGIRNAVMLTCAPCGTNSMILGVSTGIEPIFSPIYERSYRDNNVWKKQLVVDPLFRQLYEKDDARIKHCLGAFDVTPEEHIRMQASIQKYIDQSLSKTCNLSAKTKYEDIKDIILDYASDVKGFTIYKSGSRGLEPLKAISINKMKKPALEKLMQEAVGYGTEESPPSMCDLSGGNCE